MPINPYQPNEIGSERGLQEVKQGGRDDLTNVMDGAEALETGCILSSYCTAADATWSSGWPCRLGGSLELELQMAALLGAPQRRAATTATAPTVAAAATAFFSVVERDISRAWE